MAAVRPGVMQVVFEYVQKHTLDPVHPRRLMDREIAVHFKKFVGIGQTEEVIRKLVKDGYLVATPAKETNAHGRIRCYVKAIPGKVYVQKSVGRPSGKFQEAVDKYGLDEIFKDVPPSSNAKVVEEQAATQAAPTQSAPMTLPMPKKVVERHTIVVPNSNRIAHAPAYVPAKRASFDQLFSERPDLAKVTQRSDKAVKVENPEPTPVVVAATNSAPETQVELKDQGTVQHVDVSPSPVQDVLSSTRVIEETTDGSNLHSKGRVQLMIEMSGNRTDMLSIPMALSWYNQLKNITLQGDTPTVLTIQEAFEIFNDLKLVFEGK